MALNETASARASFRKGLVSYLQPAAKVSEQYRSIRANIRLLFENQKMKSLLVTSPAGGEGKTTTVTNLAVSMAYKGSRVLVVDANVRKPSVTAMFQLERTAGLTDVLAGRKDLKDAVYPTEIGELDVMPAGTYGSEAHNLMDNGALAVIMQALNSHYDIVLVDAPAVLGAFEVKALANCCDAVLLVLEHGRTKEEAALNAKLTLEFAGATLLGAVLNEK
ncbi:CpsD/CapB family tyrosine-protein kinase [Gorillibacterium timonense]|uniref:CpsD/CapB family tyrosine-protein kinase n=1 Tax=Gorillibacterium timonense TaxID=1689269 RepID=UPI00071E631F|nr:CpsD/CapB family tyrosine-protein kinase [Gorillibacterium timonense]